MELKSAKPIGLMAVVVDEASETVEPVKVDTLRMMAMVVNHATKSMIFSFAWGGYDSKGLFHMDPHRLAGHRSIQANVDNENEVWNACACDAKGNPVLDHGEGFVKSVLTAKMMGRSVVDWLVNGHWSFEEIELSHNGQSIFKKEKSAGQKPRGPLPSPEKPHRPIVPPVPAMQVK